MRFITVLFLSIFTALLPRAAADVIPVWSTGVAVPGELTLLYLIDTEIGQDTFSLSEQPRARFASVQTLNPSADANPMDPNRSMVEILPILVRPDKAGELQIDDISVEYRSGRKAKVKIPKLPVRSTAEIKWYDTSVPYGALWYTPAQEGYVHQPVKAALKLFFPRDCHTSNLPQMQAVGVKISSMQPAVQGVIAMVHSRLMEEPIAFARGQNWRTADFTGEFTPFREGASDVTGKILIARQRGFFLVGQEEAPLPTLTLSALPLPPGAPQGFSDTVGQYSVSSRTEATSLAMNEAVEVEITVRGSGNLQQIACPLPSDASDWKLVPATRKPLINAAGETVGMVFSQLMRPVAEVGGIPSFSLSYFDPAAMAYKNAATAPIALPWRESDAAGAAMIVQASAPPPAGAVPVEEMTDIYDYLPLDSVRSYHLPRALWLLLYLPALIIFGCVGVRACLHHAARRAGDRARERELSAIAAEKNGLDFLKKIGAFIESRIPAHSMTPELRDILTRRDDEAFRPGAAPEVSETQRNSMLKSVRKALATLAGKTLLLALLLLPLAPGAGDDAAEQLYRARQYSKALDALTQQADTHQAAVQYDMGNCCYRLNKPGQAALHYARALQTDPQLREARANLAFIQRKEGAILPVRSGADSVFTLLTCSQLWCATIVCTAALALCLALLLLLRHRAQKPWLHAATILFTTLSLLCALDWVYYTTRETPDLSSLPPADIAYVLQASTARTAAAADAPSVIQLPASTPVHLLAKRGSWSYIETATGVRGWVESDRVEALLPGSVPRIPISVRFY